MGANAVTTFPTYTTGQVLEAADLNITNCGVPTFADGTARDGAFGGTGEKTLAEGQLCYLEDSNIVQYYDGSSWATVGPATPGSFVRITGASFTTAASVEFANDVFTSTYKIYLVVFNVTASSSSSQNLSLRVRDNSGPVTGSNYQGQAYYIRHNGTLTTNSTTGQTSQVIGQLTTTASTVNLWISNPTASGDRTNWWGNGSLRDTSGEIAANTIMGQYTAAGTHTGLNFFVAGTMTGEYDVYGLED